MPRKKYPYCPIFLDIENRDILIVGGGNVAARKAETMVRYGARVTVVAPEATAEISEQATEGNLCLSLTAYDVSQLAGRSLVIAATGDRCINARVARDCRRRRIPVNVVDATHLSEVIVPSIVEQGSVQIATSTGGKSPALARLIRETLQKVIGPEFAEVNDVFGALRADARRSLPTDDDRKRFFEGILSQGVLELLREGKRREGYGIILAACRTAGVRLNDQTTALLEERSRQA